ncbi:MAG TPA: MutL protein [Firmicutes bacterium]|nr:MutL protein [Bacillota bacterium]
MTKLAVLIDIGSTFTKATAVDLAKPALAARASHPTTPGDVSLGLQNALSELEKRLAEAGWQEKEIKKARRLACSSAAGGLRMIAIGLVQDLTAKAARQAALGAGARVLKTYSFQLTEGDRQEISDLKPDIILLAGGTDGGNSATILHNAKVLASLPTAVPIVIAGNRSVADEVNSIFPPEFSTYIAGNVMPQIGKLDVEPAREVIRQVFIEKIIYAKGLDKASRLIEGIFMPTPAAVLSAGNLLAKGTAGREGFGDLVIVDIGGATTDIHSLGAGLPTQAGVVMRGLPEPFAKRTVEGDLGVRVSVLSLLQAIGKENLAAALDLEVPEVEKWAAILHNNPQVLPQTAAERKFDHALGYEAVKIGVGRHVGRLAEIFTPSGRVWVQEGKDLSEAASVIGTGGVMINSQDPFAMLKGAEKNPQSPFELRPQNPTYFLDKNYLLAPLGLLAADYPAVALTVLTDSLQEHKFTRRDQ